MRSSTLLGYAIVLEDIMGQLQKLCLEREVLKDGDSVSDCAFIMYWTLLMEDAISLQTALFWTFF